MMPTPTDLHMALAVAVGWAVRELIKIWRHEAKRRGKK